METRHEIKIQLMEEVEYSVKEVSNLGGQSCGIIPKTMVAEIKAYDIKIEVCRHRSQLKNREEVKKFMELIIDDILLTEI